MYQKEKEKSIVLKMLKIMGNVSWYLYTFYFFFFFFQFESNIFFFVLEAKKERNTWRTSDFVSSINVLQT